MQLIVVLLTAVLGAGIAAKTHPVDFPRSTSSSRPTDEILPGKVFRISVQDTRFVQSDGTPFVWQGITAFRLAEFVASGNDAQAAAYLDWAARNDITVVRVLAMARHLFRLTPEDGLRALPRLLDMAARRGVHVEVVALADTAGLLLDLDAHVRAVGKIAAQHPNAFVEIANEPYHPTQDPALHEEATLVRLAALIPGEVVVAYGSDSPGADDGRRGGDYITVHTPRADDPWEHVLAHAEGRALVERYGRPVVNDEPIGAAAGLEPGRRDNSPERFRAAAILTRMTGMHPTFHYEGGLHAHIPSGIELACFNAWLEGLSALPAEIGRGTFERLAVPKGAAFETRLGDETWVFTLRGAPPPASARRAGAWSESGLWVKK